MRRSLAVLASIGLGIGTVALATPAHAATSVVDNDDGSITVSGIANLGDEAKLCAASVSAGVCENADFSNDMLFLIAANGTYTAGSTVTVPPGSSGPLVGGSYTIVVFTGGNRTNALSPVSIGSGGGGSGSSGGAGSAPASEIQQFGLPASGNCEDGVTEAMNWSGIGMDGWGISWARWMNEGAGGAVCTRTVMYDTSTAKWTVS